MTRHRYPFPAGFVMLTQDKINAVVDVERSLLVFQNSNCKDPTWAGREIALIGMAATGLAAARVLPRRGAEVTVHDPKPAADLAAAIATLREIGAAWRV